MAHQKPPLEESKSESAPGWVVTFADLMGQLLGFFIVLVSMSTIQQAKFQKMLQSVHAAFGHASGANMVPGHGRQSNSPYASIQARGKSGANDRTMGGAETVNLRGKEYLCKTVREGTLISMGDKVGFAYASADLTPEMREALDAIMDLIGTYPNRILVKGHTSTQKLPEGMDAWTLSYQRARAVGDYLVSKGLNPRRLQLSACGLTDPVDTNLTPEGQAKNRRADVIVSEDVVEDAIPRRAMND
jgi:chemotaxis protein MotB